MGRWSWSVVLVVLVACGDSTGDGDDGAGDTATTAASDGASVQSTGPETPATEDTGPADSSSSGDATTGELDCSLPEPPLAFEMVTDAFAQSEDLVFDGAGNMLAKQGDDIVAMDAGGQMSTFATVPGPSFGLRMMSNGDVVIARWMDQVLTRVSAGGSPVDIATGLTMPNGMYVDLQDRVWFTDPGQASIFRVEPDGTVTLIIAGSEAGAGGGIVFDEARSMLWYTASEYGQLRRIEIDPAGNPVEFEIVLSADGFLQGLALDQCGNLYTADTRDNELMRLEIDETGQPVGEPVVLVGVPSPIYGVQFGKGDGFSPTNLYAIGNPGTVVSVDVGIPGADVPPG
ncbi:MAG: hypothetical protein AAF799_27080 [Myxococcota bacterium]